MKGKNSKNISKRPYTHSDAFDRLAANQVKKDKHNAMVAIICLSLVFLLMAIAVFIA